MSPSSAFDAFFAPNPQWDRHQASVKFFAALASASHEDRQAQTRMLIKRIREVPGAWYNHPTGTEVTAVALNPVIAEAQHAHVLTKEQGLLASLICRDYHLFKEMYDTPPVGLQPPSEQEIAKLENIKGKMLDAATFKEALALFGPATGEEWLRVLVLARGLEASLALPPPIEKRNIVTLLGVDVFDKIGHAFASMIEKKSWGNQESWDVIVKTLSGTEKYVKNPTDQKHHFSEGDDSAALADPKSDWNKTAVNRTVSYQEVEKHRSAIQKVAESTQPLKALKKYIEQSGSLEDAITRARAVRDILPIAPKFGTIGAQSLHNLTMDLMSENLAMAWVQATPSRSVSESFEMMALFSQLDQPTESWLKPAIADVSAVVSNPPSANRSKRRPS